MIDSPCRMVDVRQERVLYVRVQRTTCVCACMCTCLCVCVCVCVCECVYLRARACQRCLNDVFQTLHLFTSVPVTVTYFPRFVSLTTNKTPMIELYTFMVEARVSHFPHFAVFNWTAQCIAALGNTSFSHRLFFGCSFVIIMRPALSAVSQEEIEGEAGKRAFCT